MVLDGSPLALCVCSVDDVLVHFGAQEAGVGVLLHQAVDLGLDLVQAGRGGLHQEDLLGSLPCAVVDVDLSGRLHVDELVVDLGGFGGQFGGVLDLLVILTGHPELNVLVAELGLQEGPEHHQPIFVREELVEGLGPSHHFVCGQFLTSRRGLVCRRQELAEVAVGVGFMGQTAQPGLHPANPGDRCGVPFSSLRLGHVSAQREVAADGSVLKRRRRGGGQQRERRRRDVDAERGRCRDGAEEDFCRKDAALAVESAGRDALAEDSCTDGSSLRGADGGE